MKKCFVVFVLLIFLVSLMGCFARENDDIQNTPYERNIREHLDAFENDYSFWDRVLDKITENKRKIFEGPSESDANVFIAIHNEPGNLFNYDHQEEYWPALVDMIAAADSHGHKLTLLFNPQWGSYILQDPVKLQMLRNWEANGHEIGIHHHGPHRGNAGWNGYTNQEEYMDNPLFIGTIDDMMDIMTQLPASGTINTGCFSTEDEDAEYDFPEELIYAVNGGGNGIYDMLSVPVEKTYASGNEAISIGHGKFGGALITPADVQYGLDYHTDDEIIGLVYHTFEYGDDPSTLDFLFQFLENEGVHTKTVTQIMDDYEFKENKKPWERFRELFQN